MTSPSDGQWPRQHLAERITVMRLDALSTADTIKCHATFEMQHENELNANKRTHTHTSQNSKACTMQNCCVGEQQNMNVRRACANGTSHLSKRLRVRGVVIALLASLWPGVATRWTHIYAYESTMLHIRSLSFTYLLLYKSSYVAGGFFCCYNSHSNGKLHINQLNHCTAALIWHALHVRIAAKVSKFFIKYKV